MSRCLFFGAPLGQQEHTNRMPLATQGQSWQSLNASSEIEYHDAYAQQLGPIDEADDHRNGHNTPRCVVASASIRLAAACAHHVNINTLSVKFDQPLMRNVLTFPEAMAVATFDIASLYERIPPTPNSFRLPGCMVVGKYWCAAPRQSLKQWNVMEATDLSTPI